MAEVVANGLRFHVQKLGGQSFGRNFSGQDGRNFSGQDGQNFGGQVRHLRAVNGSAPGAPERRWSDERPRVVMIHGLTVDLSSFYLTIAASLAIESHVYLYDLRGHGRSEVPPCNYRVADHVDDLMALLDAWGLDQPVHVVGNSFGGMIALSLAHRFPERVASMFLIEPHLSGAGWGQIMVDGIRDFEEDPAEMARLQADPARLRWVQRTEAMLQTTSLLHDLAQEPFVPMKWLEQLRCPVFSIYGSESDIVEQALRRDRHIPGCRPCVIAGGTHMLLAEEHVAIRAHAIEWIRDQNRTPLLLHG